MMINMLQKLFQYKAGNFPVNIFLLRRQQQPNNQPSKINVSFENLSQKEYIYKHARSIDFFHFLPISKIYIL